VITLIVEFNETIGFWQFVVKEEGEIIHFRPGFRTREQAEQVGDGWIRDNLGGIPLEEDEEE